MGILDKLAFWKKEDEFNFDQAANQDMNQPSAFPPEMGQPESAFPGESEFNVPQSSSPQTSPQQYAQASRASLYPGSSTQIMASSGNRDFDLINSKLDTIRAMLASIEQRLDKLEKTEPKTPGRLW